MSDNSHSIFKFKPFVFSGQTNNHREFQVPKFVDKKDVVYSDAYCIAYGVKMNEPSGNKVLWKYSCDSSEWRIVSCKDIPQKLESTSLILSGNTIVIFSIISSGRLSGVRMYLGNLADEFKECGMKFKELKVSGDIHRPSLLNRSCDLMDGQYVYKIGYDCQYMINVYRLDLSAKKWDILDMSRVECAELYTHKAVFYKGGIYVFGHNDSFYRTNPYALLEMYKFDVVNKKWEFIQVDPDLCPLLYNRMFPSCFDCVQCPEKSNLIYIFDKMFEGVWRFNIDNLLWEKLEWKLPPENQLICFLSNTVTNSGRLYCHSKMRGIYSAWLIIPKLKVISWEAMIFYFKEQMFASSDEHLKQIGLPKEFYDRIIDGRHRS